MIPCYAGSVLQRRHGLVSRCSYSSSADAAQFGCLLQAACSYVSQLDRKSVDAETWEVRLGSGWCGAWVDIAWSREQVVSLCQPRLTESWALLNRSKKRRAQCLSGHLPELLWCNPSSRRAGFALKKYAWLQVDCECRARPILSR